MPGDLELLLRIVGWKKMIREDELPAVARLVSAGLLVVELRHGGQRWAEATDTGMVEGKMGGDRYSMRASMSMYFGRGPSDD